MPEPCAGENETARENARVRVYHPFLFGLFPIVSMLSTNVGEALPRECLLPAGAVVCVAVLAWLVLRPVLPCPHKRGVVLSLLWIPFYAFGAMVDAFRARTGFHELAGPLYLALAAIAIGAVCAYPLVRLRRSAVNFQSMSRVLNVVAVLAVCIPSGLTGIRIMQQRQYVPPHAAPAEAVVSPQVNAGAYPDIFYVILDAYTRADYMRCVFDFDNEPFLAALRSRGFYVADRSRSNYTSTQMSLASSLNLNYVDDALVREACTDWDAAVPALAAQVWRNAALDFLKQRGYEFVTFASGMCASEIPGADRYFTPPTRQMTEFQQRFVDRTPFRMLLNRLPHRPRPHRALFVLDGLERIARAGKPMFVFAHIMAPHLPHRFDADGRTLTGTPPYEAGYRGEVAFLNKRLIEIVDAVLARHPNTVFIFQGDHGPWSNWRSDYSRYVPPWQGSWEDFVRDRSAILNAYYFPNRSYDKWLYPEITPVNTFRMLFDACMNAKFERLEDVSYVVTDANELRRIAEVY